ncbi:protein phosphatase 1 regulatory subunit 12A-like isoform X2 [Anopheles albimanus]|uniref:protein phosphatase 1 regulatory subunit 12A-like isoform X2 n=1 Tax=Anopheles albimanus TaxID=7167 RepID=UPI0016417B84|nr:protein phosphatase 1 regulatory subunit 12A-like isoform X2 [Anopheles albimanus]
MSLDNRNTSAQFKRAEQLKRWEESDMAKQASGIPKSPSLRRIQFTPGCIFLAACDAGDKDEVEYLLQDGADIDTANVDGLTALHQACIDDNLDMVEFLVQKGADVNRKDNEGWTPLHATASCGFLSIARYLIENGADLAAINSDGELPVDLANSDAMEDLIQHHNEQQGIDCDEARQAEERIMLSDATKWLRTDSSDCDRPDPKTGATAMHVAAAKGYNRVLKLLLEGRGDIDRQDVDGWTPLHAAVYWGQKEATQMLLDAGADIDIQNYSGQLASDNAPKDILVLLDKARKNQARRTKRRPPSLGNRITDGFENSTETPTKVIRVEMKPIDNNKEKEDADGTDTSSGDEQLDPDLEALEQQAEEDEEVAEEEDEEEDDGEEEEEENEEEEEMEEDTVDDVEQEEEEEEEEKEAEQDVPDAAVILLPQRAFADKQQILLDPRSVPKAQDEYEESEEEVEEHDDASVSSEPYSSSNPSADSSVTESETDELLPKPVPIISRPSPVPLTAQIVVPKPRVTEPLARTTATATALPGAVVSGTTAAPPPPTAPWRRQRAVPTPVPRHFYANEDETSAMLPGSSSDAVDYANLCFATSSSGINNTTATRKLSEKENQPTEPDVILRRTQSFENDEKFYQKYAELRARIQANSCTPHALLPPSTLISNTKTSTTSTNNNNSSNNNNNNNNNNINTTTTGSTSPASNISSYLVQRSASLKDHRTLRKTTSNLVLGSAATTATTTPASAVAPTTGTTANTTTTVPSAGSTVGQTAVSNTTATVSPPTSPSGTPTTTPTAGQIRRSFVPPTRDEESETQRKAHAKRVRETRRSTQGVTLDEIKSAEQLVKKKNNPSGTESETTATGVNVMNASTTNSTTIPSSTSSPSSLSCYTSSPSSLSSSMTSTASTTTTASINDRVPAVKNACNNNNNDSSNNGEQEVPCGDELKNGDEPPVVVSASFTLPAPSAVTSSIEQGEGDGGGGGEDGGGGRRPCRSLRESDNEIERKNDKEESDEKEDVTVSYTISAPALRSSASSAPLPPPSSTGPRSRLSSNEAADQRGETVTPSVTATFHVSPPTTGTTTATSRPISATGSSSTTGVSSGASIAEHPSVGSISASATIRTTVGNGPGGAVSNSNNSNITNTSTTTNNTNAITTAGGGGPITTTSSSTYTKRSLFDIDNANSLTLAEKLRHEANKYAIAADADSELGPLGEDSTATSRAVRPATVTNTNEANPADSDSNSGSNAAANAPTDNSASVAVAAPLSPSLRKDAATVSGSAAERRPSWRLKVDGGSKFKLEDASTPNVNASTTQSAISGSSHESTTATPGEGAEHGSITTKLTSTSALAQRRLQQQQQQQNGDSTTSNARPVSASVGSSSSTVPSLAAAGEQYNRVPGTTAASTEPVSTDASLLNLRRPPRSATASGGSVAGEENKENDKENDSRTAQATQAVIQRRRRQKRRSTGVVPVGMEDLDPDRQDSPVDGEEKETGSERGRSRVGSTASELDTASQQEGSRENGGDFIDYKALYEQEKAEKEKLKASLRKKDEEVVTLKAALDRFTTATTKNNSLSELEKRERRAMERKMSEMEEELKLLQKYKTENERLRAENRALTRVVSKLTTSAQNQMQTNKQ